MADVSPEEWAYGRFFPQGSYTSHWEVRNASCGWHSKGERGNETVAAERALECAPETLDRSA